MFGVIPAAPIELASVIYVPLALELTKFIFAVPDSEEIVAPVSYIVVLPTCKPFLTVKFLDAKVHYPLFIVVVYL